MSSLPETLAIVPVPAPRESIGIKLAAFGLLGICVFAVHGYHPFANDAGIYVAGVRKLLDPALFQPDAPFVVSHTRFSIFAHLIAAFIHVTHLPLEWVLLGAHLASIYLFLWACWRLARAVFDTDLARWCSVLLGAALFTLPVAGTALTIMDPYVTARSFSTPLGVVALAAMIEHRWAQVTISAILCVLLHPLMGMYVLAFLIVCWMVATERIRLAVGACGMAFLTAGSVWFFTRHVPVEPAYQQAVLSAHREFLFLAKWQWFEIVGLAAPLVLYVIAGYKLGWKSRIGQLCLACVLVGLTAILITGCFVHARGPYVLVSLQLLRSFHLIYALGVVLLGGVAGWFMQRMRWFVWILFAVLFASMYWSACLSFVGSVHLELPGQKVSSWQEAFLWARDHTPKDAIFGMEPSLLYTAGEDEQGFRAISERSALADDKDAGVVVVFPALAREWATQRNAEAGVNRMTDAERREHLHSFGVNWMLLAPDATTSLDCPYQNSAVKICQMQ